MPPSPKTILLMRHAKSSWGDRDLKDFERPLNNRGKKDAPKMGQLLKRLNLIPDAIVSSPAARAKATVLSVVDELGVNEEIISWNDDLYYGGSKDYLDAIRQTSEECNVVMTVGHNPMTEQVIAELSDRRFTNAVPTATIACFEVNIGNWKDVRSGECTLKWIKSPKDL
ncbi:MAG: histidine phosphatase family protein [Balneolaceae bacterium]